MWQSWRASWTRWTLSPDLKDGGSETVGGSGRAASQAPQGTQAWPWPAGEACLGRDREDPECQAHEGHLDGEDRALGAGCLGFAVTVL